MTTGSPPTVGNELKFGHLNAFPQTLKPLERRRGSVEDEFVSPNFVYKRMREQHEGPEEVVIQINHPRAALQQGGTGIGWFNNAGFDPTRPLDDPVNRFLLDDCIVPTAPCPPGATNPVGIRNIDFDVLEAANAARPSDFLAYRSVRRDWLWLMLEGMFKPATGVSDSHRLIVETPGYARTYVLGLPDQPHELDRTRFVEAVRQGRMMATTGPVLSVGLVQGGSTAGPGETFVPDATPNPVRLELRVEAAEWIPVDEVRVLQNGVVTHTFDVSSATGLVRLDESIELVPTVDSAIIVEAGPVLPADPSEAPPVSGTGPGEAFVAYSDVVPGAIAWGFTNPVFVDLGGDGFDPPGLPDCRNEASVLCEEAIALPLDESHSDDTSFLTRLRVPDEVLATLR